MKQSRYGQNGYGEVGQSNFSEGDENDRKKTQAGLAQRTAIHHQASIASGP